MNRKGIQVSVPAMMLALLISGCSKEEEPIPTATQEPAEKQEMAAATAPEPAEAQKEADMNTMEDDGMVGEDIQTVIESGEEATMDTGMDMTGDAETAADAGRGKVEGEEEQMAPVEAGAAMTEEGIDAQALYAQTCRACHDTGLMGAPKLGNKEDWAARLATGKETLLDSAINGKNSMPPRGGNPALSDEQLQAVVEYMMEQAQ